VTAPLGLCVQDKSPFKPLAERVREFQYKTPPRFKSRPSKVVTHKKKSPITKAEVSATAAPGTCCFQQI